MFDFQKLDVYQKAKAFSILMAENISTRNFDRTTNDQFSELFICHDTIFT